MSKIRKMKTKKTEKRDQNIPYEDLSAHPELSRKPEDKKSKPERRKHYHRVSKETIEKLNKPIFSNIILSVAIIFGIVNITFGILGILAIFGLNETNSWVIYNSTAIFGWEQLKITGFILIIIGIIMLWSVPYYFLNKNQQADSYLIIGLGISILYGFIYVLIVIADIIADVVEGLANNSEIVVSTYYYLPIMLALFSLPLFRILAIRHMIILPDLEIEIQEEEEKILRKNFKRYSFRNHSHKQHRRHHNGWKHKRWKWENKEDTNQKNEGDK